MLVRYDGQSIILVGIDTQPYIHKVYSLM